MKRDMPSKIVRIAGDEVFIGTAEGKLIRVRRENLTFAPNIGDLVEIFEGGGHIVVSRIDREYATYPSINWSHRTKLVAGLLGIFLGGLGVHRFYLGYTKIGILQILVTIATCGLVGSIWGLVEGILIICSKLGTNWHQDAEGRELLD